MLTVQALVPMSQELLDDIPKIDYSTADVDLAAANCRYCKMNRTRYGRPRCRNHDYLWNAAWFWGQR